MSKAVLIAGGYRIGDTSHLIPIIRHLAYTYGSITWITGEYEEQAARYISRFDDLHIDKVLIRPEHRKPGDLSDRSKFSADNLAEAKAIAGPGGIIVDQPGISFEIAYRYADSLGNYPELTSLPVGKISLGHVCVQPDSISKNGSVKVLQNLIYPLDTHSLGKSDELLVKGAKDSRGLPFDASMMLLATSSFNVCIHSSLACFSFYMDKPTIVIHFFSGQFRFSDFHQNCVDLVQPSEDIVQRAVDHFAEKYRLI